MICTEVYYKRVMGEEIPGTGLGVRWEGGLIYQHIYDAGSSNQRFIPVIFEDQDVEFIPTPTKGATHYSVYKHENYEALYCRLTGQIKVSKPPLGKVRDVSTEKLPPLPPKEVKTDVGAFVVGFIDVDLWNQAQWSGTFFMHNGIDPPWLGIIFQDRDSAKKIFQAWRERFGKYDLYEELRLSIVEGDIEGEEPGYSVHISADYENIFKRADELGINIPRDLILIFSRLHRMNPAPDSPNLRRFKEQYRKFKSYRLIPGVPENGSIRPFFDLSITKREIHFRHVDEIKSRNDPDAILIGGYRDSGS